MAGFLGKHLELSLTLLAPNLKFGAPEQMSTLVGVIV